MDAAARSYADRMLTNPHAMEALRIGWRRKWPFVRIHQYAHLLAAIEDNKASK